MSFLVIPFLFFSFLLSVSISACTIIWILILYVSILHRMFLFIMRRLFIPLSFMFWIYLLSFNESPLLQLLYFFLKLFQFLEKKLLIFLELFHSHVCILEFIIFLYPLFVPLISWWVYIIEIISWLNCLKLSLICWWVCKSIIILVILIIIIIGGVNVIVAQWIILNI